jgi:hypothetical protein
MTKTTKIISILAIIGIGGYLYYNNRKKSFASFASPTGECSRCYPDSGLKCDYIESKDGCRQGYSKCCKFPLVD